jgi:hypothetical protein
MVRRPTAQHSPEALNDSARRTLTRPPLHAQLGIGRSHVLHQGPTMPGRSIDRDDDRGIGTGRRGARAISEGRRKCYVPALWFALTRLRWAACWLLQEARRQLPRHRVERGHTIDLVLVLPRTDGGTMALHPQRSPSGRHQGKAGCVLTPQDACAPWGFFFHAASSARATRCSSGAPRRERDVGR